MQEPDGYHVAIWLGLTDKKAREKTEGLAYSEMVGKVTVFRLRPIPGLPDKFVQRTPPSWAAGVKPVGHLWVTLASCFHVLRSQPNICVGISLFPHAILARFGAFISRSQYGVWYIGTDLYFQFRRALVKKLLVPILREAQVTMTMGERSSTYLTGLGWRYSTIVVGRNAYQLDGYFPAYPKEIEWDIVFTGRLDARSKNLDLFVASIAEASKKIPSLKCVVVGGGKDRVWFEKRIKDSGVRDHISLVGSTRDVSWYLHRSRLLMMTSRWEGLPSSIVEALSCGVPVISTDVGDISDICKHGINSLLAQSHSSKEISDLIVKALSDRELLNILTSGAQKTGHLIRADPVGRSSNAWEEALCVAVRN